MALKVICLFFGSYFAFKSLYNKVGAIMVLCNKLLLFSTLSVKILKALDT